MKIHQNFLTFSLLGILEYFNKTPTVIINIGIKNFKI